MNERILKTLILPIDDGQGNVDDVKYLIPQGTVTEADLEEAEGTKADAIVRSASGAIASFDDGGDLPMKSLKVNIVPKQSGSGDPSPSNVRAISGWSEAHVTRSGKNLIDLDKVVTDSDNPNVYKSDGWLHFVTGNIASGAFEWFPLRPTGQLAFSAIAKTAVVNSNVIRISAEYTDGTVGIVCEVTTTDTNEHIINGSTDSTKTVKRIYSTFTSGRETFIKPMAVLGSTPADYVPYNGTDLTISFGQTVYGGTLDVVSGKLIVETEKVTYSQRSQLGTFHTDTVNWIEASLDATKAGVLTNTDLDNPNTWCNKYKAHGQFAEGNMYITGSTGRTVVFGLGSVTEQEFADSLSTPIDVVYTLKNPTEIDLTPTEVKSLLGDNNVWSESGTVEVEYRADTSLVIENILARLEALEG